MVSSETLFQPAQVGEMSLFHRIVMATLTRLRIDADHVPLPVVVKYYAQRASVPGTLLITEATLISHQAGGYAFVPGIWSDKQVERWKEVTDAVHAKGSYIYLQLWALGRAASPSQPTYEPNFPYPYVSASNIPMEPGDPFIPRPLEVSEIQEYIAWYTTAAKNAERAGFDGVEIHAANGYLLDQFLQDVSNVRTDGYGGSVENRARFTLEVVDAVVEAVGAKKTAIRISPWSSIQGMRMADPVPTFQHLVQRLKRAHPTLSYLHVIEPRVDGFQLRENLPAEENNDFLRAIWASEGAEKPSQSWFISTGGHDSETALKGAREKGDLIAFGRMFIGNPDLPYRLKHGIPLNQADRTTFYIPTNEPKGYTDYPFAASVE
ncbi:FMN-linked oxidoreductase [Gymnopus androsaceus JB14]|uniref:FMN-linked oxidoreductase n=1 Tax=Gymnopus androsaceus JB14 TaxID=1447944 RepID=A0A6A4I5C6_9AGAR|nr:FMN-linked oxidoreductase [Gymnopus androsaceus JB14]